MSDDESVPADDAATRAAIDGLTPTVREFAHELERRMVGGESTMTCKKWAMDTCGVPYETYEKIRGLIVFTWRHQYQGLENVSAQRDDARQKYLAVYQKAMDKGNLFVALKAIDSICRLDGLDAPITMNLNMGVGIGITNQSREQVSKLVDKMRELAARKTGGPPGQIAELTAPGQNGHSKNGHTNGKIIEIEGTDYSPSDTKDDDDGDGD